MKKEDIKLGLKVKYDDEIVTIKEYFPQIINTSPSGDVIVQDKDGLEELVNHNELELFLTKEDRIDAYKRLFVDDEEWINSFLEDNKREDN